MKFRLVEEPTNKSNGSPNGTTQSDGKPVWPPTRHILDRFDKLDSQKSRIEFIKTNILRHKRFKNIFGVRQVIIESILTFGLNPRRNPFLDFVSKIEFPLPDAEHYKAKMKYVYDSFKNKKLDLRHKILSQVLLNPSLYERNLKEFQYTLNAFHLMSNPTKAGAYLKDVTRINLTQFLKDGSDLATSTIKPAGNDGRKGDTIFNVIESWAEDNEYSPEEIASNKKREKEEEEDKSKDKTNGSKYVLEDVIPREQWSYEIFKKNIEMAFKHKADLKINSTKEECLEKAYIAFEYPKLVETSTLATVQNTKNKIYNKTPETIDESDVKTFGDPVNKPDEPIHIKVFPDGKTKDGVSGVFVFHKFVPLSKDNINNLKQLSAKYVRDMEVKTFLTSNDRTLDKLQGLITIIEQVG